MNCPCKDCRDRTLTCHGVCIMFAAWQDEQAEIKRRRQEEKDSHPDINMVSMRKHWQKLRFGRWRDR